MKFFVTGASSDVQALLSLAPTEADKDEVCLQDHYRLASAITERFPHVGVWSISCGWVSIEIPEAEATSLAPVIARDFACTVRTEEELLAHIKSRLATA